MPAVSEKQQKFMGAELGRMRAGKKTKTGMSEGRLRDFARKKGKKKGKRMSAKDQAAALRGK